MIVKLLTEQHLEFLSLTGGCTGSSECTLVKMPHCWKSYVTAHMSLNINMCFASESIVNNKNNNNNNNNNNDNNNTWNAISAITA